MNVIGILRDSGNILNPVKETEIEAGDVLLLLGTSEQIAMTRYLFRDPMRYPRPGAGALKDREGPAEGVDEKSDAEGEGAI